MCINKVRRKGGRDKFSSTPFPKFPPYKKKKKFAVHKENTHKSINLCDNICIMQGKTRRPQLFVMVLRTFHSFISICKTKQRDTSDNSQSMQDQELQ